MVVSGFEKFNPFYKKRNHGRSDAPEGKLQRPEIKIVREDVPLCLKIAYWLSTLLWGGTLIGICVYHIFEYVCK